MSTAEMPDDDLGTKGPKVQTLNTKLPLSRVKKIVKMDEDVIAVSNAAAQLISASTERFAAYFAEQSFFFTLAEKKKGLSYRHCASAVARLPQLDFLADVVPPISKTSQATIMQSRKSTSKSKNGAQNNDNEIPDWARAHPEALAKIQAAQAAHALLEGQNDKENGAIEKEADGTPTVEGDQNLITSEESQTTHTNNENEMQQDTPEDLLDLNIQQQPLSQAQLNPTLPGEPSIEPDEEMDNA